VSREYGIPAVVGTGYASRLIKDGMKIRVDGFKGVVEILE
jgi:phosphoenolpyruvate synthase (EC 2.7.9.2)